MAVLDQTSPLARFGVETLPDTHPSILSSSTDKLMLRTVSYTVACDGLFNRAGAESPSLMAAWAATSHSL